MHLSPPLPSPSWVSPLHRAESKTPHQDICSFQLDGGPALGKLVAGNGLSGGHQVKIGMHGHTPGAYLGTWGIRDSLPEKDTAPRWAVPGPSGHKSVPLGIGSAPRPTPWVSGPGPGGATHSCSSCQPGAPEPHQSQPVSTATGQAPPSPCPRPLAQGPIPSRAWVPLPTSLGARPRANALTPRRRQHTDVLVFGSMCTRDVDVRRKQGGWDGLPCPPT